MKFILKGRVSSLILMCSIAFTSGLAHGVERLEIAGFPGLLLMGPKEPDSDLFYISFAGDFGFDRRVEDDEFLLEFARQERALLDHFDVNVVNMEFLYGLSSEEGGRDGGNPLARELLRTSGFEVVALANNHALDQGDAGVTLTIESLVADGFEVIGTRDRATFEFQAGDSGGTIFSITNYTDVEDRTGRVFKFRGG